MSYYLNRTLQTTLDDAITRLTEGLEKEGFGILSHINVANALKLKLNVDFREYRILGACNPNLAYQALEHEDKIGTLLPCNVIVQEIPGVGVEIAAIDPVASMRITDNPKLNELAAQAREKLRLVLERLL
jgi:uncharacterized protein (DUF302 family)